DDAEPIDATMNKVMPTANMRRKPTRSATAASGSRETTTIRLYAMTTHTMSAGSIDSARASSGKATLAMLASSTATVRASNKVAVAQWRRGVGRPSETGAELRGDASAS